MSRSLKDFLEDKLASTVGPAVKDFSTRHQRGANAVKTVCGLFVCRKCNYSQLKKFHICPKCGYPQPGLYVKKG